MKVEVTGVDGLDMGRKKWGSRDGPPVLSGATGWVSLKAEMVSCAGNKRSTLRVVSLRSRLNAGAHIMWAVTYTSLESEGLHSHWAGWWLPSL